MTSFWSRCALATVLATGCSATPPPASSPPPALLEAGDVIPRDLDLVVRVDLARLRSVVGERRVMEMLHREEESRGATADPLRAQLVEALGQRATSLYLGFRGAPSGPASDTVLVLSGDLRGVDPEALTDPAVSPTRKFRALHTSEPGVITYERSTRERGAPVRVWFLRGKVAVLSTAAEIDSVERVLRAGADADRLEPPADAVISFAARPRLIDAAVARKYPVLAELLGDVTTVEGGLDLETGALRGDVALAFRSAEGATEAERRVRELLVTLSTGAGGPLPRASAVARSTSVRRDGPTALRLLLRASGDDARAIVGLQQTPLSRKPC